MKDKRGFTLIELLAVIVILAIILVIVLPKALEVVENSKRGSIESSTKLIASQIEKKYIENTMLEKENPKAVNCSDVTNIVEDLDLSECEVSISDLGIASVTKVKGLGSGKFAGYTCSGTKSSATCTK